MSYTLKSEAATIDDVRHLMDELNKHNVKYMLVGGYALAMNGLARATEDIDILISIESDDEAIDLLKALSSIEDSGVDEKTPLADIMPIDGEENDAIRIIGKFIVDVMYTCCGKRYDEMKKYITSSDLNGVKVIHVNLDGLLLLKQGIRPKDIADKAMIELSI